MPAPWYVPFTPKTTKPCAQTSELKSALASCNPGDDIVLTGFSGNYDYIGGFAPSNAGSATDWIRIRGTKGARVIGFVDLNKQFTRGDEIEITNNNPANDSGIKLQASNTLALGNFIHDTADKVGLAGFNNNYVGQLAVDNIIIRTRHQIYSQNRYPQNGYEYYANNIILDVDKTVEPGNAFNVHLYAQQNYVSGFHLYRNIIAGGEILIGSASAFEPDHHNIFEENVCYKARLRVAYQHPSQAWILKNYLALDGIGAQMWQGENEQVYQAIMYALGSQFKFNTVYVLGSTWNDFRTSRYASPGNRVDGDCRLRAADDCDFNKYFGAFHCAMIADGSGKTCTDLAQWRNETKIRGKEWDTNSTFTAGAPPDSVIEFQSDYDPLKSHAAIMNWSKSPTVTIADPASNFVVYDAYDPLGPPISTSINKVATIQTSGKEFMPVIIRRVAVAPPSDCADGKQLVKDAKQLLDEWISKGYPNSKKIKDARNRLGLAIPKLDSCH